MIELYNQADKDNITRTKLSCDVQNQDNAFMVEFVQSEFSDLNKWKKPKVLTDMFITRYYLPEIFGHISSKRKLESYIDDNYGKIDIMAKIEEISKSKQKIVISLPTTIYPTRRGYPSSVRAVKDTHWPLIVKINGEDVSRAFMDFGDFGENAVRVAYHALFNGVMPTSTKDLFYIDGVKSLHDEIIRDEMGD
jgi:hypothetical protein